MKLSFPGMLKFNTLHDNDNNNNDNNNNNNNNNNDNNKNNNNNMIYLKGSSQGRRSSIA